MPSLRTAETEERYRQFREAGGMDQGCVLCGKEALERFQYWKIVENEFPYDKFAVVHDMLVPERHTGTDELTDAELTELNALKRGVLAERYQYIIEATHPTRSMPHHYHLHLVVPKEL